MRVGSGRALRKAELFMLNRGAMNTTSALSPCPAEDFVSVNVFTVESGRTRVAEQRPNRQILSMYRESRRPEWWAAGIVSGYNTMQRKRAKSTLMSYLNKHRMALIVCFCLLSLLFYLWALAQRDEIREAVLRGEAASWRVRQPSAPLCWAEFVSVDGEDPSDGFVRRFHQGNLRVFKASQGVRVVPLDAYTEYWVDPATGVKGGFVTLRGIWWRGPLVAQVDVDYHLSCYTDTVMRTPSGWAVTDRRQTWVH